MVATYDTGGDGMYYFHNVIPSSFFLLVANRENSRIVVRENGYQDIPPICIRY